MMAIILIAVLLGAVFCSSARSFCDICPTSKGERGAELQVFLLFPSAEPEQSRCAQRSGKEGVPVSPYSHVLKFSSASNAGGNRELLFPSLCFSSLQLPLTLGQSMK